MFNPDLPDAPRDMKEIANYVKRVNANFLKLSRSMQLGTTYIVIGSTNDASSGSGGGSGPTPTGGYRAGILALAAGTTTISFSSPLVEPYVLIIEIYDSNGILMPQSTIDSNIPKTALGFTLTTSEAVTVKYTAVTTI
jgi:hypothetical protein